MKIGKLANFNELLPNFPDVLGFGSYMSLMVSIFCEFCCSLFLIAGLLQKDHLSYRLHEF